MENSSSNWPNLPGARQPGVDSPLQAASNYRLWESARTEGGPAIIQGSDLDEVYASACEVAGSDCEHGTLVVHLDLPTSRDGRLPLPRDYPLPEVMNDEQRQKWLAELVAWWQLDRSSLEHRMPFVHGARLRRYRGKIDQIARIKKLLKKKASTRAVAVLIDPFRDFTTDGEHEEFASFCLVEFKRRDAGLPKPEIDAITFYRAQEFARLWPVNIAELRHLQLEICDELACSPGRITTITADARTHSRSPTQVAMPIIDRWLDQAPEKIHALANALVFQTTEGKYADVLAD